ncbi:MAG: hypothetical protein IKH61_01430 [Bacteroidales bacterium]|nr:hypothetical protein [Bacteroidales bacterium]
MRKCLNLQGETKIEACFFKGWHIRLARYRTVPNTRNGFDSEVRELQLEVLFFLWGLILLAVGFFLPQEYREPPYSRYICYPIFAIMIFGLILSLILDYQINKKGLTNKSGWISNKTMRGITFIFVFIPFYIVLLMIISAWIVVIAALVTGKIPRRF